MTSIDRDRERLEASEIWNNCRLEVNLAETKVIKILRFKQYVYTLPLKIMETTVHTTL